MRTMPRAAPSTMRIGAHGAGISIDNRPTEKGLETRNFFLQFPIPVRVTVT